MGLYMKIMGVKPGETGFNFPEQKQSIRSSASHSITIFLWFSSGFPNISQDFLCFFFGFPMVFPIKWSSMTFRELRSARADPRSLRALSCGRLSGAAGARSCAGDADGSANKKAYRMGPPRYQLVYKPLSPPLTIVISTIKPLTRQLNAIDWGPHPVGVAKFFEHEVIPLIVGNDITTKKNRRYIWSEVGIFPYFCWDYKMVPQCQKPLITGASNPGLIS